MRNTRITVALSDTSEKKRQAYFQRLKEMTPSERIGLGIALWEAGDSLQRATVRWKHPEAEEIEITFRIAVSRFGAEAAQKAYGKS